MTSAAKWSERTSVHLPGSDGLVFRFLEMWEVNEVAVLAKPVGPATDRGLDDLPAGPRDDTRWPASRSSFSEGTGPPSRYALWRGGGGGRAGCVRVGGARGPRD